MPIMEQRAEVTWTGNLMQGSGRLSVGSGAFPEQTVTFGARTEGRERETSPEELIAGAHAICYSMALSHHLAQSGSPPNELRVSAVCSLDRVDGALKITRMRLEVEGDVPGLGNDEFARFAREAEERCPVSNALRGNVEIELSSRVSAAA
jgi:osmotically inducible protein OsmC